MSLDASSTEAKASDIEAILVAAIDRTPALRLSLCEVRGAIVRFCRAAADYRLASGQEDALRHTLAQATERYLSLKEPADEAALQHGSVERRSDGSYRMVHLEHDREPVLAARAEMKRASDIVKALEAKLAMKFNAFREMDVIARTIASEASAVLSMPGLDSSSDDHDHRDDDRRSLRMDMGRGIGGGGGCDDRRDDDHDDRARTKAETDRIMETLVAEPLDPNASAPHLLAAILARFADDAER